MDETGLHSGASAQRRRRTRPSETAAERRTPPRNRPDFHRWTEKDMLLVRTHDEEQRGVEVAASQRWQRVPGWEVSGSVFLPPWCPFQISLKETCYVWPGAGREPVGVPAAFRTCWAPCARLSRPLPQFPHADALTSERPFPRKSTSFLPETQGHAGPSSLASVTV